MRMPKLLRKHLWRPVYEVHSGNLQTYKQEKPLGFYCPECRSFDSQVEKDSDCAMNPYMFLSCIVTFFLLPAIGMILGVPGVFLGFCAWVYIWFVPKNS